MRKSYRAVERGRVAKAAGDSFEEWVDIQHEGARVLGVLAHVAHNQPATKSVRGKFFYSGKSGTDYSGALTDGRPLAVEAKSTKTRLMRSVVRPKQVEQLDIYVKAGWAAYLLVEFRRGIYPAGGGQVKERFAIPWNAVPWKILKSAESIDLDDMKEEWRIPDGECYLKRGVPMPVTSTSTRNYARE